MKKKFWNHLRTQVPVLSFQEKKFVHCANLPFFPTSSFEVTVRYINNNVLVLIAFLAYMTLLISLIWMNNFGDTIFNRHIGRRNPYSFLWRQRRLNNRPTSETESSKHSRIATGRTSMFRNSLKMFASSKREKSVSTCCRERCGLFVS